MRAANPLRMYPPEAQALIRALGGQAAVMRGMGLSEPTVRRIWNNGCAGANCAALRLAYRRGPGWAADVHLVAA